MPSGSWDAVPSASFVAGMPNSTKVRTPRDAMSTASLRSDSIVCWTWPGIEEMGMDMQSALGGLMPKRQKQRKVTVAEAKQHLAAAGVAVRPV